MTIIIGSDNGLAPFAPTHYPNQCKFIVNSTIVNKIQQNVHLNVYNSRKCIWKRQMQNGGHFVQVLIC